MKRMAFSLLVAFALGAAAQTEDDLLQWVTENRPRADAGEISQLDFHREMHRRIAIIPAATYPHKVGNLRWIGRKVDILEAIEAGTITPEQGQRRLAEADAEMEEAESRERTAEAGQAEARRAQQEQAAAQNEAQRRALILQMIQGNQARQPYQLTPHQIPVPRQSTCTSAWDGAAWRTTCR